MTQPSSATSNRLFGVAPTMLVLAACAVWAAWIGGVSPAGTTLVASANAQSAATAGWRVQSNKAGAAAPCAAGAGRLGVSRVVEIDTTRGPRFGVQYNGNDFLREGEVVLTFDDGPLRRHSRMVLDALAAHCTKATFYMVGQMAVADPEMVREIAASGHTIAVHTWSHKNLRAAGATKATQEIELGISAIQRALGEPISPFFRFPYLADSQAMLGHLAQRNFGVFSIDVDSKDFRTHDPRAMKKTLFDGLAVRKKGILLFHDIQFSTAHGIRGVLDELAERGFKIVHIMPAGQAVTQPSYDAMADAELNRRKKLTAGQPLANRSVVWPMTPPGVPIERFSPQTTHAATGAPPATTAQPRTAIIRPTAAIPKAVNSTVQTGPPPAQQHTPAPAPASTEAAAAATERPALRSTGHDDDWRARALGGN